MRSEIQLLISRIPLHAARRRPETLGRRINRDAEGALKFAFAWLDGN